MTGTNAPPSDFEGRAVLVTGGASGIGRATAALFAARGASVMIADLYHEAVVATAADISGASGARVESVVADVSEPTEVEAMVDATVAAFGRLDAAVNNAGTPGVYGPLPDQHLDDWQRTLAVNLTGTFLCVKAELAVMAEAGYGAVVNVSSAAGLMGFANLPAYVASKHGVVGLTKSVALEFARSGIRVNAVCPGNVHTPMLETFTGGDEKALLGMGRVTPIGRLAEPAEIAEAIVWLCSDAASFVTGHAMAVDGGVLAT